MLNNIFQIAFAIIVVIIGEAIVVEMLKTLEFSAFVEFLFMIALPLAVVLGVVALFRR